MPVKTADTEIAYTGDGTSIAFSFPFEVSVAADFGATINGVATTAYTLSGLGVDTGGTCTFTTPPANGAAVVLYRAASYDRQLIDYQYGGEFAAETVDSDFDRVVQLIQQLATLAKRTPRVKRGDLTLGLDLTPSASKLLAWSADALSLVNVDASTISPSTVITTAIGQALMTAANAAAARTAIGATSQTDVDASIASQTFSRNRLINGDFRIHQRQAGVSPTTSALAFGADMWQCRSSAAPSGTLSMSASGVNSNPGEPRRYLFMSRPAGTYVGSLIAEQVIETDDCWDLAGKVVNVQAKVRRGIGFGGSQVQLVVVTGTGTGETWASLAAGTWTGIATQVVSTMLLASLTTSYQTISGAITIPAGTKEIAVRLVTTWAGNAGNSTDRVEWTDVQIEEGDVVSEFERRPFSRSLSECQRYYEKSWAYTQSGASGGTGGAIQHRAQGVGTLLDTMRADYKTTKFSAATPTWYSTVTGTAGQIRDTSGGADVATTGNSNQGDSSTGMPTIAATVAGRLYEAHWDVSCIA